MGGGSRRLGARVKAAQKKRRTGSAATFSQSLPRIQKRDCTMSFFHPASERFLILPLSRARVL